MKNLKKLLQHLAIVVFIASTLSGMSYALVRYKIPGVPRFFRQWSYGMMAPYQRYRTFNEELIAEGKTGDSWEHIDLNQYLPYITGERAMRSYLVTFRRSEALWPRKYREYALLVKGMENRRGRAWEDVRLSLEKWPMSPAGYEYLRRDPFVEITPLTYE